MSKEIVCEHCGSKNGYWQKVRITQWALIHSDGTVADIGGDAGSKKIMKWYKKKYCVKCGKLIRRKIGIHKTGFEFNQEGGYE